MISILDKLYALTPQQWAMILIIIFVYFGALIWAQKA